MTMSGDSLFFILFMRCQVAAVLDEVDDDDEDDDRRQHDVGTETLPAGGPCG